MSTQDSINHIKAKTNGKWTEAKELARATEKEVIKKGETQLAEGEELFDSAQDVIMDVSLAVPTFIKKASTRALDWAKANPVQAGIGGVVLFLFLGSRLFGRKNA